MFAANLYYLTCLVSLFIVATTCQFPLDGKSFSLRSVVTSFSTKGHRARLEEQYSVEQHRATIEFKTSESGTKDRKFTFYFDSQGPKAALIEEFTRRVEPSSAQQLAGLIKLPDVNYELVADDFIVGPARLLFLIEKSRYKMKPMNIQLNTKINNVPVLAYQFEYIKNSGERLDMTIFYSVIGADQGSLPMQVMIHSSDDITVIDYGRLEILEGNEQYNGRKVVFDRFMFRPAYGVAKSLSDSGELLFADKQIETTKFSFRSTERFTYSDREGVASFDGRLKTLRYDSIDSSGNEGFLKKQLSNFNTNRMYHTLEQGAASSTAYKVLDLRTLNDVEYIDVNKDSGSCVMAKIFPDSAKGDLEQLTIGRILAGSDQFVYMGRAQVRGIAAKVYEALDPIVPIWLEQPIAYKTSEADERVRLPGDDIFAKGGQDKTLLNVVLYFAEQDTNHPLLLVEIYKKEFQVIASV